MMLHPTQELEPPANPERFTLIGADLNKRLINAKPPKTYIPKFEGSNKAMADTLATHLIERQGMGIDEDDYETFLAKRAAKLWTMIEARIHPKKLPPSYLPRSTTDRLREGISNGRFGECRCAASGGSTVR
jgi:Uncharacterized conserved protein